MSDPVPAQPARPVRLSVRGLILREGRLLLVNAWPDEASDLWCAPGGGVEPHSSLPDNLMRELREETGLTVSVGPVAMVNEFHDPAGGFHQVDIYFRCTASGPMPAGWTDPEGVVTRRRFFSREEMGAIRFKPDSLPDIAWGTGGVYYDPLEPLLR